jgi:signal transduction histidine kinase
MVNQSKVLFFSFSIVLIGIHVSILFFGEFNVGYLVWSTLLLLITLGILFLKLPLKKSPLLKATLLPKRDNDFDILTFLKHDLQVPLLLVGADETILFVSKGFIDVLQFNPRSIEDFKGFPKLWSVLNQSIALENGANFQWERLPQVYDVQLIPLLKDHVFKGLMITIQDITDTHKLDQVHSEFLSNLSHELKTPLAAILGASDILNNQERKLTIKERTMFTQMIKSESNRMQRLMGEMSQLTLLDQKPLVSLIKSEFNLFSLMEEVMQSQHIEMDKKQLNFTIDPSCNRLVFLDRDKAFQIFSNLLSNAIRYTEKGGVMIRAETIKKFTVIFFSDTGVGIEPQNVSRIFNRFFRTDFARNRVSGGAGLGLAITRAIVEAHAGKIEVESQLGQGTTFTLSFPNIR